MIPPSRGGCVLACVLSTGATVATGGCVRWLLMGCPRALVAAVDAALRLFWAMLAAVGCERRGSFLLAMDVSGLRGSGFCGVTGAGTAFDVLQCETENSRRIKERRQTRIKRQTDRQTDKQRRREKRRRKKCQDVRVRHNGLALD